MPSGNIVGRVSFNTFALDGGTTTFDVISVNRGITTPTTFDLTFNFTVEAYGGDGLISVTKNFSIIVNRAFNAPYENLYIQAMPPQNDRDFINSDNRRFNFLKPCYLFFALFCWPYFFSII